MGVTDTQSAPAWWEAVPPPALYVPAAHAADAEQACAAVVGPGLGVRYDMRVVAVRHSQRQIGVVTESVFWQQRQHLAATEPQWVPVDHVWVEQRQETPAATSSSVTHADPASVLGRLAQGPDQPSPRIPVPARSVPRLSGTRIIQSTPRGMRYGLRAVSEAYTAGPEDDRELQHEAVVRLVGPATYYAWRRGQGLPPHEVHTLPLWALWAE